MSAPGGCLHPGKGVSALGVSAPGRGVSAPGGCLLPGKGVSALGVSAPGVSALGGVCSQGVSAPVGWVCWGCGILTCTEADTPTLQTE